MPSVRKRLPVRPLLAVAAVASIACSSQAMPLAIGADPAAATSPASSPAPAPSSSATNPPTPGALAPPALQPRVMRDGRPASGNVTMRAIAPPDGDSR